MKNIRTIEEINEKISKGTINVVTAEEMTEIVKSNGIEVAAKDVDIVTTGTFGAMCSSGMFLNFGHADPPIKMEHVTLNGVEAYHGNAAVDVYLGVTKMHPERKFDYGGGHVIEDLIAGKDVFLRATSYGTDCYPRRDLQTYINLRDLNQACLLNPRNLYQNYNVAVNLSSKVIYTYLGVLQPRMGNANFSSAGQLSPLLNDPFYRITGIGTKIFLGGGSGYVIWEGTQHNPTVDRGKNGVPTEGAGTLALIGDMKEMNSRYIKGASLLLLSLPLCLSASLLLL